jgi:rhamnose transport system permease protein
VRETLRFVREGEFVRNLPVGFQWFGLSQAGGQLTVIAVALTVFALLAWGLANLEGGRNLYALGSNADAARLAGIPTQRTIFALFVASGVLTGLASLLSAVRFADVDPNSGTGLEMQAIAAAVVGGTAVQGGRGTLIGTLAGVLLLTTIGPGLVFLRFEPQWERAVQGGLILGAVASDVLFRRKRAR